MASLSLCTCPSSLLLTTTWIIEDSGVASLVSLARITASATWPMRFEPVVAIDLEPKSSAALICSHVSRCMS